MASSFTLPILNRSQLLGQTHTFQYKPNSTVPNSPLNFNVSAKFDLFQILGGRGLLNGERGVEKELKRSAQEPTVQKTTTDETEEDESSSSVSTTEIITTEGGGGGDFEKELSGLTGGFPGGEKGLQKFIKNNPPLKKEKPSNAVVNAERTSPNKKPKAPQLPLLMPGMIAIVKNENNPFYMYCGIVQRITDGRAGVLFEGGNWDRLVTFRLDELERREKGPPMKNPRSCVLELEQPPFE